MLWLAARVNVCVFTVIVCVVGTSAPKECVQLAAAVVVPLATSVMSAPTPMLGPSSAMVTVASSVVALPLASVTSKLTCGSVAESVPSSCEKAALCVNTN